MSRLISNEIQRAAVNQLYYACVSIVDRISVVTDTLLHIAAAAAIQLYAPLCGNIAQ